MMPSQVVQSTFKDDCGDYDGDDDSDNGDERLQTIKMMMMMLLTS